MVGVGLIRRRVAQSIGTLGAAPFASRGAVFDFAFFLFALLPPAPFIPSHCRSILKFPHSMAKRFSGRRTAWAGARAKWKMPGFPTQIVGSPRNRGKARRYGWR